MWQFLKNLPLLRLFSKPQIDAEELKEERWVADFSKPHKARFVPDSGPTYESALSKAGLSLTLKKGYQLAWVEDPLFRYADVVIEAKLSLHAGGGYGAAGFQFRRTDDSTYYSFLISTKGYYRFDVLFNGTTMPLIGWTETPEALTAPGQGEKTENLYSVRIIALGDKFTFIINDKWAGEITDDTIPAGKIAFAVVSYEADGQPLQGLLHSLVVDSRTIEVEAVHLRWNRFIKVDPQARFRLAETFLAMNQPLSALVQIKRIWKTAGAPRSQEELLFAARCALQLSLYSEAEEYLNHCLESDIESDAGRSALVEKAKLLYLQSRYADLEEHARTALEFFPQDPILHTLLGHAYMNLGRPDLAGQSYDQGLEYDRENGLIAQNAGSAYEKLGDHTKALERYLRAGSIFLNTENYNDLALVVPRLLELGSTDPRVHSLAGKFYFAVEDFSKAERELELADPNESSADPAVPYLKALLHIRRGQRRDAVPLLQRAVQLAPDSALFHFRLAENIFLLQSPKDEKILRDHLKTALELDREHGWTLNLAAQVELRDRNLEAAEQYLQKASVILPEAPEVRINHAELAYLKGNIEQALALLQDTSIEDTEGLLAHEAGSILARAGRLEEAKPYFESALRKKNDRIDFIIDYANCLIDLGLYGEADEILSKAYELEDNEAILEMIGYVAYKKGEFPRSEGAYRLALEKQPKNPKLLSALAWVYITMARWNSAEDCITALEQLVPSDSKDYSGVRELRERFLLGTTRVVGCAGCERSWRVPIDPPAAPPLRLVAEPPDELPAGTCLQCGKTYCIGCAKGSLDSTGRFVCPTCGERLKLYDEGLKKILADWASGNTN